MENKNRIGNFFGKDLGQFTPSSKFIIIACLVLGALMLIFFTVKALSQTKFAGSPISNLVSELMGTIN